MQSENNYITNTIMLHNNLLGTTNIHSNIYIPFDFISLKIQLLCVTLAFLTAFPYTLV